jgi:hypothetical protein
MAVVDGPTARRAMKIIHDFIIPHAYEVFGLTTNGASDIDTLRAIGSFILTDNQKRLRYTASDLTSGVHNLREFSRSQVFDAVAHLVAGGWLEHADPMLRKEQKAYTLNADVRSFFEKRTKTERARKKEIQKLIKAGARNKN